MSAQQGSFTVIAGHQQAGLRRHQSLGAALMQYKLRAAFQGLLKMTKNNN